MFKFTIHRNLWLRGEGSERSFLLRHSDGKMCCVGLYLKACGIPDSLLEGVQAASAVDDRAPVLVPAWLRDDSSGHGTDVTILYEVNDSARDETTREREIVAMFAKHDVEVKFDNNDEDDI